MDPREVHTYGKSTDSTDEGYALVQDGEYIRLEVEAITNENGETVYTVPANLAHLINPEMLGGGSQQIVVAMPTVAEEGAEQAVEMVEAEPQPEPEIFQQPVEAIPGVVYKSILPSGGVASLVKRQQSPPAKSAVATQAVAQETCTPLVVKKTPTPAKVVKQVPAAKIPEPVIQTPIKQEITTDMEETEIDTYTKEDAMKTTAQAEESPQAATQMEAPTPGGDKSAPLKRRKLALETNPFDEPIPKKLKQITEERCILCNALGIGNLRPVSFLDEPERVVRTFKRHGSIALTENDVICTSCVNIGTTLAENLKQVKKLCKTASDRRKENFPGKQITFEQEFAANLSANLTKMVEKGRLCSVALISKNRNKYSVHRSVLAANTRNMDRELESGMDIVMTKVGDEAMRALIRYLYTGELRLTSMTAKQLFPYCERWDLEWAASQCLEMIRTESIGAKPRKVRTPKVKAEPEDDYEPGEIDYKSALKESDESNKPDDSTLDSADIDEDAEPGELCGEDFAADVANTNIKKEMTFETPPVKRKRGRPRKNPEERLMAGKESPAQCHICNKWFSRRRNLTDHIQSVHEKFAMSYMCEICGISIATKKSLHYHIRAKHPEQLDDKERMEFSCPECGKTAANKSQLQRHIQRNHSDERNVICDTCGMSFKTKSNLWQHNKVMHDPSQQLICDIGGCGKMFKGKFRLKDHQIRAHAEGEKRHKCKMCTYSTHFSKSLRQHYAARHAVRMSLLSSEWQNVNMKKKIFQDGGKDTSKPPPYTLEPINPESVVFRTQNADGEEQDITEEDYYPAMMSKEEDTVVEETEYQTITYVDQADLEKILEQAQRQQDQEVQESSRSLQDFVEVIVSDHPAV